MHNTSSQGEVMNTEGKKQFLRQIRQTELEIEVELTKLRLQLQEFERKKKELKHEILCVNEGPANRKAAISQEHNTNELVFTQSAVTSPHTNVQVSDSMCTCKPHTCEVLPKIEKPVSLSNTQASILDIVSATDVQTEMAENVVKISPLQLEVPVVLADNQSHIPDTLSSSEPQTLITENIGGKRQLQVNEPVLPADTQFQIPATRPTCEPQTVLAEKEAILLSLEEPVALFTDIQAQHLSITPASEPQTAIVENMIERLVDTGKNRLTKQSMTDPEISNSNIWTDKKHRQRKKNLVPQEASTSQSVTKNKQKTKKLMKSSLLSVTSVPVNSEVTSLENNPCSSKSQTLQENMQKGKYIRKMKHWNESTALADTGRNLYLKTALDEAKECPRPGSSLLQLKNLTSKLQVYVHLLKIIDPQCLNSITVMKEVCAKLEPYMI